MSIAKYKKYILFFFYNKNNLQWRYCMGKESNDWRKFWLRQLLWEWKSIRARNFWETLNNHSIEWPEIVAESECSSVRSYCNLVLIPECCEEINENDQDNFDEEERNVKNTKEKEIEEADKRLEKASKLLDDGKVSLTRFLQMLDPTGEWFPKDSVISFEFEDESMETKTIESISIVSSF